MPLPGGGAYEHGGSTEEEARLAAAVRLGEALRAFNEAFMLGGVPAVELAAASQTVQLFRSGDPSTSRMTSPASPGTHRGRWRSTSPHTGTCSNPSSTQAPWRTDVEGRHVPLILFEFRVKAGREEEVERFLTNVLPSTRSYDGCLDLDVYRDTNDSVNFTIVQRWESV